MKSPLEHEHDRQKSGQSWKPREDLANQGSREKIWPIKGAERKSGHSREPRENLVNQGNREKIWPIKRDEREKNLQGGVCGGAKLVLTILF